MFCIIKFSQIIFILCLYFIILIHSDSDVSGKVEENFGDILYDAFLLTPQLLKKYGYKSEVHSVETKDGYLLEMHRIPKPGAQPVLLVHGFLDSSATWIMMGPNKGLGYILSDLNYDVWMGNVRGNRYSRKHKKLDPNQNKFWDFSIHEIGKFDLPAMIDYVLHKSNYTKLHYIGHSQGTCTFWILCSQNPEYNDKIISMQALGPVAYVNHIQSPLIRMVKPLINQLPHLIKLIGMNEIHPTKDFYAMFGQKFCKDGEFVQIICENFMFMLAGYNEKETNKTMLPVIMGHIPAGASTKQLIHYAQLVKSGYFRQFDYGVLKNLIKYESVTPPNYNLSDVKVKVALHYSLNDLITSPTDVYRLSEKLPNIIGSFLVEDKEYNHLDFVWGINAKSLVYSKMVRIMKLLENDNKV